MQNFHVKVCLESLDLPPNLQLQMCGMWHHSWKSLSYGRMMQKINNTTLFMKTSLKNILISLVIQMNFLQHQKDEVIDTMDVLHHVTLENRAVPTPSSKLPFEPSSSSCSS